MNKFITKKVVVYSLALIISAIGVFVLFNYSISVEKATPKVERVKVDQIRVERESKKSILNNFDKESNKIQTIEFKEKVYTQPLQKVYTEEEKIKILNSF